MGATGALIGVQTAFGLYNSYEQAGALKEQGRAEEQLAEQNARLLDLQAEDAKLRGQDEAGQVKRRGRFVKGNQRAGFAGQNVAVGTGSAAAIQGETDSMSSMDALTVQNDAWRESFGYKTAASNERFRGKVAKISSDNEARNTLLTGGLNAVNDIGRGVYLNSQLKSTGFKPKNPTEARFDRSYRTGRS